MATKSKNKKPEAKPSAIAESKPAEKPLSKIKQARVERVERNAAIRERFQNRERKAPDVPNLAALATEKILAAGEAFLEKVTAGLIGLEVSFFRPAHLSEFEAAIDQATKGYLAEVDQALNPAPAPTCPFAPDACPHAGPSGKCPHVA